MLLTPQLALDSAEHLIESDRDPLDGLAEAAAYVGELTTDVVGPAIVDAAEEVVRSRARVIAVVCVVLGCGALLAWWMRRNNDPEANSAVPTS